MYNRGVERRGQCPLLFMFGKTVSFAQAVLLAPHGAEAFPLGEGVELRDFEGMRLYAVKVRLPWGLSAKPGIVLFSLPPNGANAVFLAWRYAEDRQWIGNTIRYIGKSFQRPYRVGVSDLREFSIVREEPRGDGAMERYVWMPRQYDDPFGVAGEELFQTRSGAGDAYVLIQKREKTISEFIADWYE